MLHVPSRNFMSHLLLNIRKHPVRKLRHSKNHTSISHNKNKELARGAEVIKAWVKRILIIEINEQCSFLFLGVFSKRDRRKHFLHVCIRL